MGERRIVCVPGAWKGKGLGFAPRRVRPERTWAAMPGLLAPLGRAKGTQGRMNVKAVIIENLFPGRARVAQVNYPHLHVHLAAKAEDDHACGSRDGDGEEGCRGRLPLRNGCDEHQQRNREDPAPDPEERGEDSRREADGDETHGRIVRAWAVGSSSRRRSSWRQPQRRAQARGSRPPERRCTSCGPTPARVRARAVAATGSRSRTACARAARGP